MARPNKIPASKYKPVMCVQVYRMTKLGLPDTEIAKCLDVTLNRYKFWQRNHLELREAQDMARKEMAETETLPDWIYSRLSPDLKKLWDKIEAWEEEDTGVAKIELMLADNGKRVRQQLFLHALCVNRFSPTIALRKVNITKRELDQWLTEDPDFAKLIDEMEWHKGNFFEESLVRLVQEGNPSAVLFANKSFNAKRGYGQHSSMEVNVNGQVLHGVLDLAELMPYLSQEARMEVLEAIRRKEIESKPKDMLTITDKLSQEIAEVEAE